MESLLKLLHSSLSNDTQSRLNPVSNAVVSADSLASETCVKTQHPLVILPPYSQLQSLFLSSTLLEAVSAVYFINTSAVPDILSMIASYVIPPNVLLVLYALDDAEGSLCGWQIPSSVDDGRLWPNTDGFPRRLVILSVPSRSSKTADNLIHQHILDFHSKLAAHVTFIVMTDARSKNVVSRSITDRTIIQPTFASGSMIAEPVLNGIGSVKSFPPNPFENIVVHFIASSLSFPILATQKAALDAAVAAEKTIVPTVPETTPINNSGDMAVDETAALIAEPPVVDVTPPIKPAPTATFTPDPALAPAFEEILSWYLHGLTVLGGVSQKQAIDIDDFSVCIGYTDSIPSPSFYHHLLNLMVMDGVLHFARAQAWKGVGKRVYVLDPDRLRARSAQLKRGDTSKMVISSKKKRDDQSNKVTATGNKRGRADNSASRVTAIRPKLNDDWVATSVDGKGNSRVDDGAALPKIAKSSATSTVSGTHIPIKVEPNEEYVGMTPLDRLVAFSKKVFPQSAEPMYTMTESPEGWEGTLVVAGEYNYTTKSKFPTKEAACENVANSAYSDLRHLGLRSVVEDVTMAGNDTDKDHNADQCDDAQPTQFSVDVNGDHVTTSSTNNRIYAPMLASHTNKHKIPISWKFVQNPETGLFRGIVSVNHIEYTSVDEWIKHPDAKEDASKVACLAMNIRKAQPSQAEAAAAALLKTTSGTATTDQGSTHPKQSRQNASAKASSKPARENPCSQLNDLCQKKGYKMALEFPSNTAGNIVCTVTISTASEQLVFTSKSHGKRGDAKIEAASLAIANLTGLPVVVPTMPSSESGVGAEEQADVDEANCELDDAEEEQEVSGDASSTKPAAPATNASAKPAHAGNFKNKLNSPRRAPQSSFQRGGARGRAQNRPQQQLPRLQHQNQQRQYQSQQRYGQNQRGNYPQQQRSYSNQQNGMSRNRGGGSNGMGRGGSNMGRGGGGMGRGGLKGMAGMGHNMGGGMGNSMGNPMGNLMIGNMGAGGMPAQDPQAAFYNAQMMAYQMQQQQMNAGLSSNHMQQMGAGNMSRTSTLPHMTQQSASQQPQRVQSSISIPMSNPAGMGMASMGMQSMSYSPSTMNQTAYAQAYQTPAQQTNPQQMAANYYGWQAPAPTMPYSMSQPPRPPSS